MRIISLMAIGQVEGSVLERLARALAGRLPIACSIRPGRLAAEFAFDPLRRQYRSAELLRKLHHGASAAGERLLGVTDGDLYIPALTFVFGEGQVGRGVAVVSTHRLRQEFYGLPPDEELLRERLLKEAMHELGHTYGLRHCRDYSCVMNAAHNIERIDLKRPAFCPACGTLLV